MSAIQSSRARARRRLLVACAVLALLSALAALVTRGWPLRWRASAVPPALASNSAPATRNGAAVSPVPATEPVASAATAAVHEAEELPVTARTALRVCSDANNLPFSNARGEGFENRIAALLAESLGLELAYTYWPERRGFLKNTLLARRCDVVMGIPSDAERVLPTRPYYRSTYVFVYSPRGPTPQSLDAPALRSLRIGVPLVGDDGANPPPVMALAQRKIVDNLRGYSVYGDYSEESPPSRLIQAVRAGEVDIAIAWGPLAGYYARKSAPKLRIRPLAETEAPPGQRFRFDISMAVRRGDTQLRDGIERFLVERRGDIARILDAFGVPRV